MPAARKDTAAAKPTSGQDTAPAPADARAPDGSDDKKDAASALDAAGPDGAAPPQDALPGGGDAPVVIGGNGLPEPWKSRNVGEKVTGKATYDPATGAFTVTSTGQDHWHDLDYFHYVYRPLGPEGEIVVRIASLDKIDGYSGAGVMLRNDPNFTREKPAIPTAPGVQFFYSFNDGVMWGERWVSLNNNNGWQPGGNVGIINDPASVPVWLRIVRKGDRFWGYYSRDGKDWKIASNDNPNYLRYSNTHVRAIEVGKTDTMWVGFFYCPHNETKSGSAKIDNVTVREGPISDLPYDGGAHP